MSGNLIFRSFMRESGRQLSSEEIEYVNKWQSDAYLRRLSEVHPLPGATDLLSTFSKLSIPFAIGTSGKRVHAQPSLDLLGVSHGTPVVTGDEVQSAKPSPDLFLSCAERLGADIKNCVIVGDSTWETLAARRARTLGIGFL